MVYHATITITSSLFFFHFPLPIFFRTSLLGNVVMAYHATITITSSLFFFHHLVFFCFFLSFLVSLFLSFSPSLFASSWLAVQIGSRVAWWCEVHIPISSLWISSLTRTSTMTGTMTIIALLVFWIGKEFPLLSFLVRFCFLGLGLFNDRDQLTNFHPHLLPPLSSMIPLFSLAVIVVSPTSRFCSVSLSKHRDAQCTEMREEEKAHVSTGKPHMSCNMFDRETGDWESDGHKGSLKVKAYSQQPLRLMMNPDQHPKKNVMFTRRL